MYICRKIRKSRLYKAFTTDFSLKSWSTFAIVAGVLALWTSLYSLIKDQDVVMNYFAAGLSYMSLIGLCVALQEWAQKPAKSRIVPNVVVMLAVTMTTLILCLSVVAWLFIEKRLFPQ